MELNVLYSQYGQAVIQLEIIQARVEQLKQQIVTELNKQAEAAQQVALAQQPANR